MSNQTAAQAANKTRFVAGSGKKLVRFSYPHVFEPHAMEEGGTEKYSVMLLIDKNDTATLGQFKEAYKACVSEAVAKGKWGGKKPANLRNPLRDGDEERSDSPEYAGKYFMNASSKYKPGIVDRNGNEILDASAFYPGCYGRADINLFAYEAMGNKGVGVSLNNLQKVTEGENLSGRKPAKEVFAGFDNSEFDGDTDDNFWDSDDDDSELPF